MQCIIYKKENYIRNITLWGSMISWQLYLNFRKILNIYFKIFFFLTCYKIRRKCQSRRHFFLRMFCESDPKSVLQPTCYRSISWVCISESTSVSGKWPALVLSLLIKECDWSTQPLGKRRAKTCVCPSDTQPSSIGIIKLPMKLGSKCPYKCVCLFRLAPAIRQ